MTAAGRDLAGLGLEPLTARSVALSALLGTHPPRLPPQALVAVGALFGIAEGTMRTALSRMLAAGEIGSEDGRYVLGERLRRRQAVQDATRRPAIEPWDLTWWFAIVDAERRPIGERRAFRASMLEHRMGELRPETWLRPANVDGPPAIDGVLVVRGTIDDRDPAELAARLWDLDRLADRGRELAELVRRARDWLEPGDPSVLAHTFLVSVAAVRFLRAEPQLPAAIVGAGWPPADLRGAYDHLERDHGALLASFLAERARASVDR